MGRRGVTYDEVAKVAEAILTEGGEPSTKNVRERLGSGSNTTIGEHLRKWRVKRAEMSAPEVQTALPGEIARVVTAYINSQIQLVKNAADALLAAERKAAADADAEAEVEQLTDELEANRSQMAQLEVAVAETTGRLKQANDAYIALDAKYLSAEHRAAEAEEVAAIAETRVEAAERRSVEAVAREQEARADLKANRTSTSKTSVAVLVWDDLS